MLQIYGPTQAVLIAWLCVGLQCLTSPLVLLQLQLTD
jgi:hypothetical protein